MGRPRLPEWKKHPATRRNDKWRLLSFARENGTLDFISKVVLKAADQERERLRAPKSQKDIVHETILANFECCDTWLECAPARGAKGVYRSSVTKLEAKLTGDLSLGETTKGAFLDPAQALPPFVKLAYEGDFVPRTVTVPRRAFFFDANEIYGRDKCQPISFSLPDARSPRQLGLQSWIARYPGKGDHISTFAVMTECDLITALEVVLQTGWNGGPMELCISMDWQVLRSFANVPHQRPRCAALNVGEYRMIFASPHMCDNLYAIFWGTPASYSLYYASSIGGKTSPMNRSTPTTMRWQMELCTPSTYGAAKMCQDHTASA